MQAVLSGTGSSNSRGRAQQILVLQQRVNELQAKENVTRNKDIHKKNGMILDKICLNNFLIGSCMAW